jgi:hypothetical protein
LFGPATANQHVLHLPPKAISGRWGAIDSVEARILSGQRHMLGRVAAEVCSGRAHNVQPPRSLDPALLDEQPSAPAVTRIDDPRHDDMREHSNKMGRWRKDTVDVSTDELWWETTSICNRSRAPLTHHMNFVQQHQRLNDMELCCRGSPLAQLVDWKASDIRYEFEKPFRDTTWARVVRPLYPLFMCPRASCVRTAAFESFLRPFIRCQPS